MSLTTAAIRLAERGPLPDPVLRLGVSALVEGARRRLRQSDPDAERAFALDMDRRSVAEHPGAANDQHYELPERFFGLALGPRRKYSSCLYLAADDDLARAEINALSATCANADLADGQRILELGCGWGSLTLWMAEQMPSASILAVSNSASQKAYIDGECAVRGLTNVSVVTADMNRFSTGERFDRIVSVEMFEHMSNWRDLLSRARGWLAPGGRLFLHVFTHRSTPYRFDHENPEDWIGRYFFTGGLMPSHGLIGRFSDIVAVEAEWTWSGLHYARTARDWLANLDRNAEAARAVLRTAYGPEADLWLRRWRLFFLATEGLFAHAGGAEWGVSHYRLAPA